MYRFTFAQRTFKRNARNSRELNEYDQCSTTINQEMILLFSKSVTMGDLNTRISHGAYCKSGNFDLGSRTPVPILFYYFLLRICAKTHNCTVGITIVWHTLFLIIFINYAHYNQSRCLCFWRSLGWRYAAFHEHAQMRSPR